MKLEVHERIALLGMLPKEGDYAALKTIRRAKEMLSFTPEELEFYELRSNVGPDGKSQVNWNKDKASQQVKDVPVDEYTMNVIRNALAELDRKRKLTEEHMSIYEKFVVMYR